MQLMLAAKPNVTRKQVKKLISPFGEILDKMKFGTWNVVYLVDFKSRPPIVRLEKTGLFSYVAKVKKYKAASK